MACYPQLTSAHPGPGGSAPAPPYVLEALSIESLHALAASRVPDEVASRVVEGALPPPFVARRSLGQWQQGLPAVWYSTYCIVATSDGRVVGGCGFKHGPQQGRVEIGYGVAPARQGRGAATAAVRALLQLAFAQAGVEDVLARINPANLASTRVVCRLGFEPGSEQRDEDDGEMLVPWCLRRPLAWP